MTREQISNDIMDVICQFSEASRDELLAADTLEELVDSMSRIEIIFELEDKYEVEIEDEEVLNIRTAGDIIDCVEKRLKDVAA